MLKKLNPDGKPLTDSQLQLKNIQHMNFSDEELRAVTHIRAHLALRMGRVLQLDEFEGNILNGLKMNLRRGDLGLIKAE